MAKSKAKKPAAKAKSKAKTAKKSSASPKRSPTKKPAPKKVVKAAKPATKKSAGPRPLVFAKPGPIKQLTLAPLDEPGFEIIYEPTTMKLRSVAMPVRELSGHSAFVQALAFSPDGKLLVSGSEDSTIRVWNFATGECVREITEHGNAVNFVSFTPDGRLLSCSDDSTIKLWSFPQMECLRTLTGHDGYVSKIHPVGSDRAISSGKDGTVRVWDLASGEEIRQMEQGGWAFAMGVSHDYKHAVVVNDLNKIVMWNIDTGELERVIMDASDGYVGEVMGLTIAATNTGKGHGSYPYQVVWAADDKTFYTSEKELIEWDTATGDELHKLEGNGWTMNGIAVIPDRATVIREHGDPEERTFIEQMERGDKDVRTIYGDWLEDRGRLAEATSVREHGAFRYVITAGKDAIHVFDLAVDKIVAQAAWEHDDLHNCAISPDGRTLACGSSDGAVAIWDVDALLRAGMPDRHLMLPTGVAVSNDGVVLTVSSDRQARLWARDGKTNVLLAPTTATTGDAEFTTAGGAYVCNSNGEVQAYSPAGKLLGASKMECEGDTPDSDPYRPFTGRLILADGSLLGGTIKTPLARFSAPAGKPLMFAESAGHVTSLILDGELAVSAPYASEKGELPTLDRWNVETGQRVAHLQWKPRAIQYVTDVCVVGDEYAIVTSKGGFAFVSRADGSVRIALQLHDDYIGYVGLVSDTHVIAGTYLVEIKSGKVVGSFGELGGEDVNIELLRGTPRALVTTNDDISIVDYAARTRTKLMPIKIRPLRASQNHRFAIGISEAPGFTTMPVLLAIKKTAA
ncbi:MAG: WD40 repeat domain-containing protein [Kofleriaceae bacterium]